MQIRQRSPHKRVCGDTVTVTENTVYFGSSLLSEVPTGTVQLVLEKIINKERPKHKKILKT